MLHLDFSAILPTLPFMLKGMWVTLQITLCAIVIGILWGTVLAVIRLYLPKPLAWLAALYVNTFRSIPLIMVLMWFYLAIGPALGQFLGIGTSKNSSLIIAMVAFSLFEAAYYSEIIRAGIQSVRTGQNSAALALGMTKVQSLRFVVLPQAFRNMVPLLLTQAIVLFQDTSLVYVIGLADFFKATDIAGYNNNAKLSFILFAGLVYFIICFTVSSGVRYYQSRKKYDSI